MGLQISVREFGDVAILDLRGRCDSSGVSSMVRMRTSVRRQGGDVRLLRPSQHAMDVLRVLHLLDMIPTFEEENLAIASFKPPNLSLVQVRKPD